MLNYDVFEAFKSAGADEAKARKAAEALSDAAHSSDIGVMKSDVGMLKVDVVSLKGDVGDLKSTVKLHTWILGFNTAMLVALLFRAFSP